jgi:hypothetical protein
VNPIEREIPGARGAATTVVTREITVAHFHPEMPEVYGTPSMIYLNGGRRVERRAGCDAARLDFACFGASPTRERGDAAP